MSNMEMLFAPHALVKGSCCLIFFKIEIKNCAIDVQFFIQPIILSLTIM